jgi:hypothetical protein
LLFQIPAHVCREDGYHLNQKDIKKAHTREPEHWPKNAFVSDFAEAIGVDDRNAENLKQQVAAFKHLDWPTVYNCTEMFFWGTPIDLLKQAIQSKVDPFRAAKVLFDTEFGLWQKFVQLHGLQRMTDITAGPFVKHVRERIGDGVVEFVREEVVKVEKPDMRAFDDLEETSTKGQKRVKRGSSSRPAKKAKK